MGKALLARMILRAMTRRSPKADAIGGTTAAVIVGAILNAFLDAETAAAIAAPAGALVTTLVNLAFGDDVADPNQSTSSRTEP